MPRRHNVGPGPKSKTQKERFRSFLGDSTTTEASDAESFQSPELEGDHTDYGFDYTTTNNSRRTSKTSHITHPSAARELDQNGTSSSGSRQISPPRNTRISPRVPALPLKKKPRKQVRPEKRDRMMWTQIRELQKRTDNLTPKAPFGRIIREILMKESSGANKITMTALEALQTSSEIYLTNLFADAYVCTLHRGRVTLGVHDVRLVRFLRGTSDVGNKH